MHTHENQRSLLSPCYYVLPAAHCCASIPNKPQPEPEQYGIVSHDHVILLTVAQASKQQLNAAVDCLQVRIGYAIRAVWRRIESVWCYRLGRAPGA